MDIDAVRAFLHGRIDYSSPVFRNVREIVRDESPQGFLVAVLVTPDKSEHCSNTAPWIRRSCGIDHRPYTAGFELLVWTMDEEASAIEFYEKVVILNCASVWAIRIRT